MKLSEKVKEYLNWIGIAAAAITGIVTIFNYFFDDYKVSVLGNVVAYQIAPGDSFAIRFRDTTMAANQTIKDFEARFDTKLDNDTLMSIVRNLSSPSDDIETRYIKDVFSLEYSRVAPTYNRSQFETLWSYEIKNEGSKILKNVNLKLPLSGYARLYNNENQILENSFNKTIFIGEIQPSLTVKLYCWSNDIELSFNKNEQRIVYDDGSEDVLFKESPIWILVWNRKYYYFPLSISIYLIIIGLYNLYYYIINTFYKKGQELIWEKVGNLQDEIKKRDSEIETLKQQLSEKEKGFDWKKLLSIIKK